VPIFSEPKEIPLDNDPSSSFLSPGPIPGKQANNNNSELKNIDIMMNRKLQELKHGPLSELGLFQCGAAEMKIK